MRAPLVGTIILTLALCSCTATPPALPAPPQDVVEEVTTPARPVVADTSPAAPDASLEARVKALEAEIVTIRREMDMLRVTIIRLRAEVQNNQSAGPDSTQTPPENDRLRQLADIVAKQSTVHRAWMGQLNQVSIVLYPMTKPEYVDPINKQLGAEYCYMVMVVVNNNPDNTWTYKPKKGLVVAQIDRKPGEEGKPAYLQCRDPIVLIEREENKINRRMVETRERFGERELKPGEQMDTVIVFEKGTDFSKIAKLYLGEIVVPEIELPKPKSP